jgi:kinesin family protein C1
MRYQTGSGKTHTMQGSGNGAMRGIIPRAVEQILSQAKVMQDQRWQFTVSASFLEIYNENLRDLLVNLNLQDGSSSSAPSRPASAASAKQPKLAIKRDRNQKSYVDGLTQHKIDTENKEVGVQQLEALMAAAARARSVATTKMNAQSSRSHSVFMLHLYGINDDSGTIVEGSLNLCDLAVSIYNKYYCEWVGIQNNVEPLHRASHRLLCLCYPPPLSHRVPSASTEVASPQMPSV